MKEFCCQNRSPIVESGLPIASDWKIAVGMPSAARSLPLK
jgi:hypothetical protein